MFLPQMNSAWPAGHQPSEITSCNTDPGLSTTRMDAQERTNRFQPQPGGRFPLKTMRHEGDTHPKHGLKSTKKNTVRDAQWEQSKISCNSTSTVDLGIDYDRSIFCSSYIVITGMHWVIAKESRMSNNIIRSGHNSNNSISFGNSRHHNWQQPCLRTEAFLTSPVPRSAASRWCKSMVQ